MDLVGKVDERGKEEYGSYIESHHCVALATASLSVRKDASIVPGKSRVNEIRPERGKYVRLNGTWNIHKKE